jgi:AcrR family transcriptional regulator
MSLERTARGSRRHAIDRERRGAAIRTKKKLVKDFRTAEILDAAVRVIADAGFAEASVGRIAQEAGVAKGTLYLYFANKRELLERAQEHLLSQLVSSTREALATCGDSRARLEEIVRLGLRHSTDHAAFFQAVRVAMPSATAQPQAAQYLSLVAQVLEAGARSGDFRTTDAARAARVLIEITRAFALERIEREPDVELATNEIVDFFLNGVGRGGG